MTAAQKADRFAILFSRFVLQRRCVGKLHIATETVRIDKRLDIANAVAGPVKVAICGTVAPAIVKRTTAVLRRS